VWLTRFVGVEGTYLHPHQVSASGGDDTFTFKTTMDSDVWTMAGKVGAQAGVVRIYGKGGLNYHQATTKTAETLATVVQGIEYKTTGWSWLFGGGMEAWRGNASAWRSTPTPASSGSKGRPKAAAKPRSTIA
jgi:hypothetical protein